MRCALGRECGLGATLLERILACVLGGLLALLVSPRCSPSSQSQSGSTQDRVRTEIPYRDGNVVLLSELQERITKTRYRAKGRVEISFRDILITCDEAEYDEETREGFTTGTTRFSQNKQWFTCSRSEFNFSNQTGIFYETTGFTDQEFFITGRTILKTGRDTYVVQQGFLSACLGNRPKWSFNLSRAGIRVDRTARIRHVVFRIKGIPVFYAPYLIVPMEKKERSSGFMPFHYGNSSSKGKVFSLSYFQTLGRSADATLYGDYLSLRGLAIGGIFRARPNPQSRLHLQGYGINDKLGQGGAHLIVDGRALLPHDFRAVASVNITTNFKFRQAFSDSFRSATIPQEHAVVYVTRNHEGLSTNFAFDRQEVLFPARSVVIRKAPSLELLSLGTPLGNLPIVFYLRAAADGLSRTDSQIETPSIVQRFDLHPRVAFRLPSFAGFSLVPSIGFRDTYYSAHLRRDETQPQVDPQSLNRRYIDLEIDFRTPTLEKEYRSSWLGTFRHVVEPLILYRRLHGVTRLYETIRFDEEDAIADTNEVEYGILNRVFRSRETSPGVRQEFEFLSFGLTQKYYFDPTFGGSFRPEEQNIFYPLDTLTAFSMTGIQRNLASINMVLRLSPQPGISHDFRADYDPKLQRFRDASLSTFWQQKRLFVAGTYFKTNALEPGTFSAHQVQGQLGYGMPGTGFSASIALSYDIQTSKLLNSHTRASYMWDCCGIALELQQFDLGLRTERRFTFSFTLKGIGSFGSLKRPESLF